MLAAWLTLLAMGLAFLAPAVSRTLAFATGEAYAACPMHAGMSQKKLPDGSTVPSPASLDACPLCALAAGLPLPQAQSEISAPVRVARVELRLLDATLRPAPPAWRPPPRGPPDGA